jgi:hypothetical protein
MTKLFQATYCLCEERISKDNLMYSMMSYIYENIQFFFIIMSDRGFIKHDACGALFFMSFLMANPYLAMDEADKCKLLAAFKWTQLNDVSNWSEMQNEYVSDGQGGKSGCQEKYLVQCV